MAAQPSSIEIPTSPEPQSGPAFDFLGLPCELRALVYAELAAVLEFTWLWDDAEDDAEDDEHYYSRDAHFFVMNAPTVEILLVSTQMRDEYLQSACLRSLTVNMSTKLIAGTGGIYGPQPATDGSSDLCSSVPCNSHH